MNLHHIGLIAGSLIQASQQFGTLTGSPLELVIDDEQQNEIHIFRGFGNVRFVELLIPLSPRSTIAKSLGRNGPGLHHLAEEVPSLAKTRLRLAKSPGNVIVASFNLKVSAFGGTISTLFVSNNGLLLEYLEVSK